MVLKRPILVGGLGLSVTLGLMEAVHVGFFDSSTLLSAMALGTGVWWWRRRDRPPTPARPIAPPVVDRARVETQLADVKRLIDTLTAETALAQPADAESPALALALNTYEQHRQSLLADLDRATLRVAVVGDRRTGKTTLLNLLTASRSEETPAPIFIFSERGLDLDQPSPSEAPRDDLKADFSEDALLLVTDGDLTDSTLTWLKQRIIAGQGAILVFNKTDLYDPADQQTILTQLQQRMATLPAPVKVVAVAAAPRPLKVRRHQADGQVEEWLETLAPMIAPLADALTKNLADQAATLVAATTLRQGEALRQQVQTNLNQVRRQRAMPLIEQLQWVAGAAAFANPVPTLDLLATVAINGQLIMDLGKIYGFHLSLDDAKTAAGTLASLTVKLGLVELSTQVLTLVLKSHFATYLAGGMVQGMSAAYLTRMAGLSLIDYFEQAALAGIPAQDLSWDAIAQRLQTVIQQNRQMNRLQTLVKQGITILKPTEVPVLVPAANGAPLNLATATPEPITLESVTLDPITLESVTPKPDAPKPDILKPDTSKSVTLDTDSIPA